MDVGLFGGVDISVGVWSIVDVVERSLESGGLDVGVVGSESLSAVSSVTVGEGGGRVLVGEESVVVEVVSSLLVSDDEGVWRWVGQVLDVELQVSESTLNLVFGSVEEDVVVFSVCAVWEELESGVLSSFHGSVQVSGLDSGVSGENLGSDDTVGWVVAVRVGVVEGRQSVGLGVVRVESVVGWGSGDSVGDDGVVDSLEVWIVDTWVVEGSERLVGVSDSVWLSEDEVETESDDQEKGDSQEGEVESVVDLVDSVVVGVIRQVEEGSSGDGGTEGEQQSVDTQNVEWPDVVFFHTLATGWVQSTGRVTSIFPNSSSVLFSTCLSISKIFIWTPSWCKFILMNWSEVSLTVSIWVSVSSSLPNVSQQETSTSDCEDEQDQGNHTQNEESSSVSEESDDDGESSDNDTGNTESLEELGVEGGVSAVGLELVPLEGFFGPVDHQPSEDDESDAG